MLFPNLTQSLLFLTTLSLVSCAKHEARTKPTKGAVVVNQKGGKGTYKTVQAGVDALNTTSTGEQFLFIYPGVYTEQVYIPPRLANLTVQGWTKDASSFKQNTVNITQNLSQMNVSSNDLTATVRAWSSNFKMYNLNLINTFGQAPSKGQALALSAQATNQGYYGVSLASYQDTLLANKGLQLYAQSHIEGAVDFIFGQTAAAWFEGIDIAIVGQGYITASGRALNNTAWYVINKSSVRAINDVVEAAGTYLGRPWRNFARVTFQNTYLSAVVKPAGWSIWNVGDERTNMTQFEEYKNYGPGSILEEGPRANFSTQLTQPRRIQEILGADYASQWWIDRAYL